MTDEPERSPIPDPEVEGLAGVLEATLGEEFAGYPVRVDAGERGRIWIALRGAVGDEDAERVTGNRVESRLAELDLSERNIAYRISSGASGDDLIVVCEFLLVGDD